MEKWWNNVFIRFFSSSGTIEWCTRSVMQDASVSSQFGYPHIFIKYVYLMRKKNFPRTSSVPPACNRHRRSRRNTDERFVLCFGIAKWNFGDTFVIQLPKSRVKRHMNSFWFIGDALPLKLWDSRCQVESIWCRASANKWRHPREKTHRAYSQVWMPTYIPTSQKGEV